MNLAKQKNIEIIPRTFSDQEATALLVNSTAAIIPHTGHEMIVSGSMYYALSLGVPCVCVNSPHAKTLIDKSVLGISNVSEFSQLNDIDIEIFNCTSSEEIRYSTSRFFSDEVIKKVIREKLSEI
jgi:hypothetical protein